MCSFLRAIILILFTFYMALIYKSASLALLGFCEVLFVLLAFAYLLVVSFRLKAGIEIPIVITEKEGKVAVYIRTRNVFFFSLNKIKIKILYGLSYGKKDRKKWLWAEKILPGEEKFSYRVQLKEAGRYEFALDRLRIYDMSGLFYVTKKAKGYAKAIVLPKISDVGVHIGENVRNFFGEADVYDELRPGYDPTEMYGIREFTAGDKMQSVHWKLSAKMDDLVVRENAMPKACPVVLFLGIEQMEKQKQKKDMPNYYELAASVSFSLMDAGCPHYVVWQSKSRSELLRARVDDEESFYLCLTTWMQDAESLTKDYREAYKLKYRSEPYLHTLELYHSGVLGKDGKKFPETGLKDLEILL